MLRATRPTVQARIHENACPNGVAYASTKNKHFIVHDRSSWVYEWCMELNFKKKKKKKGKPTILLMNMETFLVDTQAVSRIYR